MAAPLSSSVLHQNTAPVLAQWNVLPPIEAAREILPCCGSQAWAEALAAARPIADQPTLLTLSDQVWASLTRNDWQQAFDSHPPLGEAHAPAASPTSLAWSAEEQSAATPSELLRLANREYEQKFGRIFLFCANGRSTPEILAALRSRIQNDPETEWREAGEQQRQITHLRLTRWLQGPRA